MFSTLFSRFSIVAFIAIAALRPASAAQVSPSPSPSPTALPEIGRVVTSDRRSEPIGESSRPTFVIDRARIDREGARTLADALAYVPGVQVYPYGPFGAQVNYGINGASPARTLVMIDGQPITDPTQGTVNLAQISTAGIERIEVVESSASALYGSSASGGVINLITQVPRGTYSEISTGSFGDNDFRAALGNGVIGATIERHISTGNYPYPMLTYGSPNCTTVSGASCTYPAGTRTNAYAQQNVARLSADLPLGAGWQIHGRADVAAINLGVPGRLDFLSPNSASPTTNSTALLGVTKTSGSNVFSVDLSGASQRGLFRDPSFGEDDVYWSRSQVSIKDAISGTRGDFVTGIDVSRASGIFTFPASTTATGTTPPVAIGASQAQAAAYMQAGISPFAGAHFTAGLRAEHDSPAGSVLAPSFGAVFKFAPNWKLAGNVGESFRVPTLQDLYYPGAANPNLLPEKSQDSDTTLAYDAGRGGVSATWFTRNGSNLIVFDPVQFIPVNAQRATNAGVTLAVHSVLYHGLIGEISYTDLYRSLDLVTGARLPQQPGGQVTASLRRPFGASRVAYGLFFKVVGSDGDDAANVPPPVTGHYDSYSSADAYVRYKFASAGVLSVRGYNLGNDREAPIFGYPNAGRRFTVELSTR